MSRVAVHGIACSQRVLADVVSDCVHGVGGESWLGQLPGHRHEARTVSAVAIVGSSLVVGDVFVDPILSSGDDGAPANAFEILGQILCCLFFLRLNHKYRRGIEECTCGNEGNNGCGNDFLSHNLFWAI